MLSFVSMLHILNSAPIINRTVSQYIHTKTVWNRDRKSFDSQERIQVYWSQYLFWVLKEIPQKDLPIFCPWKFSFTKSFLTRNIVSPPRQIFLVATFLSPPSILFFSNPPPLSKCWTESSNPSRKGWADTAALNYPYFCVVKKIVCIRNICQFTCNFRKI